MSIGSGNGLAPNRRQAIARTTNADPLHRRKYAALEGYVLRHFKETLILYFITPEEDFVAIIMEYCEQGDLRKQIDHKQSHRQGFPQQQVIEVTQARACTKRKNSN